MKLSQSYLDEFKNGMVEYLISNLAEDFDGDELTDHFQMTKFAISRRSTAVFGLPPMRWAWGFRLHLFRLLLQQTHGTNLTELGGMCGFNSMPHLSNRFRAAYKRTASRYPRGSLYGPGDIDVAFPFLVRAAMDEYLQIQR